MYFFISYNDYIITLFSNKFINDDKKPILCWFQIVEKKYMLVRLTKFIFKSSKVCREHYYFLKRILLDKYINKI